VPVTLARANSLPNEFAVFPLAGALLLPGGRLPLNIFEPRYLAMIEDAMGQGRAIGMIQPDQSRSATPTGPGLYRVGCLGRITSFSETDDGCFLITLKGLTRFVISVELEMQRGYRRVRADFSRFTMDLHGDNDEVDRDTLLDALKIYFKARGFEANWDAINEMADAMLVSTLAMVCPFEPAEKQALLEAANTQERANALLALLRMGAHASDDDDETGRIVS